MGCAQFDGWRCSRSLRFMAAANQGRAVTIHRARPPRAEEEVSESVADSFESTVSVLMQRVVEREQFGGEVKCQPSELRAMIDSRETWRDLARTLQGERNDLVSRLSRAEAERDQFKASAEFNHDAMMRAKERERQAEINLGDWMTQDQQREKLELRVNRLEQALRDLIEMAEALTVELDKATSPGHTFPALRSFAGVGAAARAALAEKEGEA